MPVLRNIGQLATCPAEGPQSSAGLIDRAALAWRGGVIKWVGPEADLPLSLAGDESHDCQGRLVIPGLVDCHTHLCFGGWRGDEFEMRLQGRTYQEIAAAGGGIASTVAATREASAEDLEQRATAFLDAMLALGVTTVEAKSGYGLDETNELKQLGVYRRLSERHRVEVVATFLGAHIVPPEYADDREGYIDLLCKRLIPRIASEGLAEFCDAFVETGAYTPAEGERILSTAAANGLGLKLHADQLSAGGGAQLAARLGAVSAEHLEYIDDEGIAALANSGTVAVSLPLASMYLKEAFLPARRLMDAGVPVAVATDFNPGSSPSYHLPLAMLQACLYQGMTPQEVLQGATSVAARAIFRQNRIGSLKPGYQADIVIVDAPDLNQWVYHYRANACEAVIKNGEWA
ncbi:MAG: imidazolonepropionase [Xanthomonadales bacterium]|nr:imidazolonepropionase [Xanthomonadales bacterium]